MTLPQILLQETLQNLPPEWPDDPGSEIRAAIEKRGEKTVVIDDDPMGTQTVANVSVLADWSVESIVGELENSLRATFILANTRSMPVGEAVSVVSEAGRNVRAAAEQIGKKVVVISRSDSTLRGHYPAEVDAMAEALGQTSAVHIITPFFLEGGRYTIGDIHYVAEGDHLIPAGQTEFARDNAFGYQSSNVREWVEEKTGGRISASQVTTVSIEDIRIGGPDRVAELLLDLGAAKVCFPNAASTRDTEVFALGVIRAEEQGVRFTYRSAAAFLKARGGLESRPLLTASDFGTAGDVGGLTIVGSHVPRSTSQLEHLVEQPDVSSVEINASQLVDDAQRSREIERVAQTVNTLLKRGEDVAMYTSRVLITGNSANANLEVGHRVSDGVVEIVRRIEVRPRYFIAKGGITASDIATQALGFKRAMCIGQILPGVPVWEFGSESRYPGLKYVAFPGNTGGPEALSEAVAKLR